MKKIFFACLLALALPLSAVAELAVFTPAPTQEITATPTQAAKDAVLDALVTPPEASDALSDDALVTFSFAGDCTLGSLESLQKHEDHFVQRIAREGFEYPFSGIGSLFHDDNFTLVNLEGVFTDIGRHKAKKALTFRAPIDYAQILPLAGIEGVNLSNNHTGDYKKWGQDDTRAALDSYGIVYSQDTAYTITEVKDIKVGFFSKYMPQLEGLPRLYTQIDKLREEGCDLIIASFHWGVEYEEAQNKTQKQVGRAILDYGADAVIGHHPHILQGIELYNGKPIIYSLGNFSFGGNISPPDWQTMIVQLEYEKTPDTVRLSAMRAIPCLLSGSSDPEKQDFRPILADDTQSAAILERLKPISENLPASFFYTGFMQF